MQRYGRRNLREEQEAQDRVIGLLLGEFGGISGDMLRDSMTRSRPAEQLSSDGLENIDDERDGIDDEIVWKAEPVYEDDDEAGSENKVEEEENEVENDDEDDDMDDEEVGEGGNESEEEDDAIMGGADFYEEDTDGDIDWDDEVEEENEEVEESDDAMTRPETVAMADHDDLVETAEAALRIRRDVIAVGSELQSRIRGVRRDFHCTESCGGAFRVAVFECLGEARR